MSHSRLPQPRIRSSSPDTLKRKAIPEEDEESDQPIRKLARHLQPSRTATNIAKSSVAAPKSLTNTKPLPPTRLSKSTVTRGTSAPPQSTARTASKSSSTGVRGRTASGSRPGAQRTSDDHRFDAINSKLSSIEEGRAFDIARFADEMEAERKKVLELQDSQQTLSRQLIATQEQDLNRKAELNIMNDELDNLRKKHAREIAELEMDLQRKDRLLREANEDLRNCRSDLERERETSSSLKSRLHHEANAQLTLGSENRSLQAHITAMHTKIDADLRTITELKLENEAAQEKIDDLKKEAMENEVRYFSVAINFPYAYLCPGYQAKAT